MPRLVTSLVGEIFQKIDGCSPGVRFLESSLIPWFFLLFSGGIFKHYDLSSFFGRSPETVLFISTSSSQCICSPASSPETGDARRD